MNPREYILEPRYLFFHFSAVNNTGPPWTLHRKLKNELHDLLITRGRCGRDRILLGVNTIYAISAYHYQSCEFESHSWRDIPDATLCDKVCQ